MFEHDIILLSHSKLQKSSQLTYKLIQLITSNSVFHIPKRAI